MTAFFRVNQEGDLLTKGPIVKAQDYMTWLDREALLKDARAEAEKIKQEARDDIRAEVDRAYRAGFDQGIQDAKEGVIALGKSLESRFGEEMQKLEEVLPRLVTSAVEKIIGKWDNKDLLMRVIEQTLGHSSLKGHAELRVSADDLPELLGQKARLQEKNRNLVNLDVVSDPCVLPGHYKIRTEGALIESSPEDQLDQLAHMIFDGDSEIKAVGLQGQAKGKGGKSE